MAVLRYMANVFTATNTDFFSHNVDLVCVGVLGLWRIKEELRPIKKNITTKTLHPYPSTRPVLRPA